MVCQPVRIALLLGAITAVAVLPARAQDIKAAPVNACTRTVQTYECVPETYKKIVYKRVCQTQEYDTCKWQCIQECRERVCCTVKRIAVTENVTRQVCKTVTVNEKRIVMKNCYKNVQETVMRQRLVSLGHWECRTRQALFGNMFNGGSCCDPCNKTACCPRTVTHKVWVCCPKYECCPHQVCKRVCYQQPVEVCVPCCKRVMETVTCPVCTYKCVKENHTVKYTVPVLRRVPCKATRQVSVCVPEEVVCTRRVRKCVTREVACNPCETTCCQPSCCSPGAASTACSATTAAAAANR